LDWKMTLWVIGDEIDGAGELQVERLALQRTEWLADQVSADRTGLPGWKPSLPRPFAAR
jgi:hypothetical protein